MKTKSETTEKENFMTDLKEQKCSRTSVLRQLAALEQMSHDQLREKWLDLYGEEAPNIGSRF